jgi:ketosteroid isomerase-like protein
MKRRFIMELEELEKQIRTLVDTEEVKKLHYRYVNALISAEWDKVIDCFAENAVTDVGPPGVVKGKANIAKLFREGISGAHGRGEGTIVVHPIIDVEGDKAKGNWLMYLLNVDFKTKEPTDWIMGEYDMEYVKEDGKWKFGLMKWRSRGSAGKPGAHMKDYLKKLEQLGEEARAEEKKKK